MEHKPSLVLMRNWKSDFSERKKGDAASIPTLAMLPSCMQWKSSVKFKKSEGDGGLGAKLSLQYAPAHWL